MLPTLHFMHLVLPHQPWRYYPGGTFVWTPLFLSSGYPFTKMNDQGDWVATLSEQRHLLQAQYTDALIGQMLDRLHRIGRYDESAIVVVSDHGYSFETGTSVRNVEEASLDALAYAPLLVKLPGQTKGAIDDSNVTALDVLPTIADAAGVRGPVRRSRPARPRRTRRSTRRNEGDRKFRPGSREEPVHG